MKNYCLRCRKPIYKPGFVIISNCPKCGMKLVLVINNGNE